MMRFLQSAWMVSIIGSLIFLGTIFALVRPEHLQAAKQHAEEVKQEEQKKVPDPSWNFQNPELDRLIEELRQEKEALQQKEQQLKALEARLQAERNEFSVVTQAVMRMQKEFDQNVLRLKDEEAANYRKLGKLHSAMSPEGAATIFREMPDDEVVKITAYMKTDEVSQIFDLMGRMGKTEAKRVATLTERMRKTMSATPAAPKSSP